ncbi:MAG: TIGR02996 domain-containing protein [Rubripirellula sp.]
MLEFHELMILDDIQSAPEDSERRLVYADWLEERGDPRSEFVRCELEVEATSGAADRRKLVCAVHKLREAGRDLDDAWKRCVMRSRTSEFLILLVSRSITRSDRRRSRRLRRLHRGGA